MIKIGLGKTPGNPLHVLCLGCHSDDIEIGCGGTVLRLADQYPDLVFHWVVFSAIGAREDEARRGVTLFTHDGVLGSLILKSFRDGFMPFEGSEIKDVFEDLKTKIRPDLVLTHYRKDAHQDHRLVSELTWNTFRNHLVLEYEIPKYDGDLGRPNIFVPLTKEICQKKVEFLLQAFQSQKAKHWFQQDTFLGLMRLRGMECNAPSGYAEAFYGHKLVI